MRGCKTHMKESHDQLFTLLLDGQSLCMWCYVSLLSYTMAKGLERRQHLTEEMPLDLLEG
jgi:hypothetical protein